MLSLQECPEMNETMNATLADGIGTASRRIRQGGTAPRADTRCSCSLKGRASDSRGHESPLGSRLYSHKPGDQLSFTINEKEYQYKIDRIEPVPAEML